MTDDTTADAELDRVIEKMRAQGLREGQDFIVVYTPDFIDERMMALVDALGWALGQIKISWTGKVAPDNPAWNDFRRARRVLEGRDPDEDAAA